MISEKIRRYAQSGVNFGILVLVCLWGVSFFIDANDFYDRSYLAVENPFPRIFVTPFDFSGIVLDLYVLKWFIFFVGGILVYLYYQNTFNGQKYRFAKISLLYKRFGIELLFVIFFAYYLNFVWLFSYSLDDRANFTDTRYEDYLSSAFRLLVFLAQVGILSVLLNLIPTLSFWVKEKLDFDIIEDVEKKEDNLIITSNAIVNFSFVSKEGKLYLLTFLVELLLFFIRSFILFIPIYLTLVFSATAYYSVLDPNGVWNWDFVKIVSESVWVARWLSFGLCSTNLISSLIVYLGINLPIRNIQLSFDVREPTKAEGDYIANFYKSLPDQEIVFNSWNVIDSVSPFAFTYGRNIFISRGAFAQEHFNALVAHELGHLHNRDGLILQALHNFTYPLFNHLLFNPGTIQRGTIDPSTITQGQSFLLSGIINQVTITFFTLVFGGFGVQALARFWSRFYIERDYQADEYARSLGFGFELLSYLEGRKDFDTALPLFQRWRGYTSVRIEKLQEGLNLTLGEE